MRLGLYLTIVLACHRAAIAEIYECGTELTPQEAQVLISREVTGIYQLDAAPRSLVYVPLTFHVVRTSAGTGGLDPDRICQALNDLDIAYLPNQIQFYLAGPVDYINNDLFYFGIDTLDEINELRSTNPVPDSINIYFTEILDYESGALCGISAFTTSSVQAIAVRNSCTALPSNHSSLPHEVGHYFDLYHTHEGFFGQECVNGSNCSTAGDLVCDTPADPVLSTGNVSAACQYVGTATDSCHNQPYAPDVTNFMSYSRKNCRTHFSPMQNTRAYATLINVRPELAHSGLPAADCNSNGMRDDCDIVHATSKDCNHNGVPDECEQQATDVVLFVSAVLAAIPDPVQICYYDQDADALLDGTDIQSFVAGLLGQ